MNETIIPITAIPAGAGSQPVEQDGGQLEFIKMPSEMMTYAQPILPEPENIDGLETGVELLRNLHATLLEHRENDAARVVALNDLDEKNRQFLNEAFGDGEVSILCNGERQVRIQESVLAGVWRVQQCGDAGEQVRDTIEVGDIPTIVRDMAFTDAHTELRPDEGNMPEGLMNATSLISEINDKVSTFGPSSPRHVINLSLLPHTEQDLTFLGQLLGLGPVVILSRGYGNCRITSTATKNVWWVQYFNSQESLILNTIEISEMPEVAIASAEDIADSGQRLGEILSIYL